MRNRRESRNAVSAATIAVASFLSALLPSEGFAAGVMQAPVCPKSYPLDGVKLTKVPQGWTSEVFEAFRLESVTIAVGAPNHENEIIPESKKVKGGSETIYGGLDSFGKQRWLVCNYGYGGAVRLYRELDPGIKRCTVKYVPYPGPVKFVFDSYTCE